MNETETKNINSARMANLLFVVIIAVYTLLYTFVSLLEVKGIKLNIVVNLLVSQMVIFVPGLIFFLLLGKTDKSNGMFTKIKPVTALLFVVFTWLLMPLITLVNVFSQFFTTNAVVNISGDVLKLPFIFMLLIIGVIGPFSEEFVFRGLIYRSLSFKTGRHIASAIVSALFFGLMHMNLNQFAYALVLGVVLAIIDEIFDSIWPSVICHIVVNSQNVIMMYVSDILITKVYGEGFSEYSKQVTESMEVAGSMNSTLVVMCIVLLFVSVISTGLAGLLLYGICSIEGKLDKLRTIFLRDVNKKEKVIYPAGYVGIAVCVFFMFLLEPLIRFLQA